MRVLGCMKGVSRCVGRCRAGGIGAAEVVVVLVGVRTAWPQHRREKRDEQLSTTW